MSLKIGDVVEAIIIETQLCGLHITRIKYFEQYDAILLFPSGTYNKQNIIYYTGLKVLARVLRIHENYVDLVQIPS